MWAAPWFRFDSWLSIVCKTGYNYHQQPIPELRQELESWISLSNNNLIPTSLLILSRSLYRVSKDQMTLLKQERQDNILAKTLSEATEVMENIEAAEKHELEQQELESEMSLNEIKLKELEREEQIIREELLAEAREEDVELAESEKKKELEILEDIGEAVSVLSSGSIVQDEKAELQVRPLRSPLFCFVFLFLLTANCKCFVSRRLRKTSIMRKHSNFKRLRASVREKLMTRRRAPLTAERLPWTQGLSQR